MGVFLWYFSDTLGDSSYLGVNLGLSGGLNHFALVLLFAFALLAFSLIDGRAESTKASNANLAPSLASPVLVAIALSIHGIGEGMGFGALASSTPSTSLIQAFGGYGPAISYAIHKALEGSIIVASCAACFVVPTNSNETGVSWRRLTLIAVIFTVPTLIGDTIGYYNPFDTTYLFALGLGASVYAFFKLVRSLEPITARRSYNESLRIALLVLLGFILIYVAALFHSVA